MNIVGELKELYKQYPEAKESFRNHAHTFSLEQLLTKVKKKPPKEFSLDSLELYEDSTDSEVRALVLVLAHLPAEVIYQSLGEHVLIWTWTKCLYADIGRRLLDDINRITGKDKRLLQKASFVRWNSFDTYNYRKYFDTSTANILASYEIFEKLSLGNLGDISLSEILKICSRDGGILSQEILCDYAITGMMSKNDRFGIGWEQTWGTEKYPLPNKETFKIYHVYLDAPFAFGLMYKGEPNAIIAFNFRERDTLMIHQIQGVQPLEVDSNYNFIKKKNSNKKNSLGVWGLNPFDWKKALVLYVTEWARQNDFEKIGIKGGRNNRWVHPDEKGELHLSLEEAEERYDKTAERLGFELRYDGNWYRFILDIPIT